MKPNNTMRKSSNQVSIKRGRLIVRPSGLTQILSFMHKLSIPLAHIRGATVDSGIMDEGKGLRGTGLGLPNVWRGTFKIRGERTFWNINRPEQPLVIQLQGEYFMRLVLGVRNPQQLADQINQACANNS